MTKSKITPWWVAALWIFCLVAIAALIIFFGWYVLLAFGLIAIIALLRNATIPRPTLSLPNIKKQTLWSIVIAASVILIIILFATTSLGNIFKRKKASKTELVIPPPTKLSDSAQANIIIPSKFEEPIKNGAWIDLGANRDIPYTRGLGDIIDVAVEPKDYDVVITWERVGHPGVGHKTKFSQSGRAIIFDDHRDKVALVPWVMRVSKDVSMVINVRVAP